MARKNSTQIKIENLLTDLKQKLETEIQAYNESAIKIRSLKERIQEYEQLISDDKNGE